MVTLKPKIEIMTKAEKIEKFDPNAPSEDNAGIFGLPFDESEADIILLPVPWEATVSYGSGASLGPDAILNASYQVDLCHHDHPDLWMRGIHILPTSMEIKTLNEKTKATAGKIISAITAGEALEPFQSEFKAVNEACSKMNDYVYSECKRLMNAGKFIGLLGGDHSTPFGAIKAVAERHQSFGVLVIDAHMDFRKAYEGFEFSHASIFYNVLTRIPEVSKMVQVGIRDYCLEEKMFALSQQDRAAVFFDRDMKKRQYEGTTWSTICQEIVDALPEAVYVSVDIDGLDPKLCPNTGTPVAGGLQYEEAVYLLNALKANGKKIIGFDLCEVSPGEDDWDGNVGARLLFQLCGLIS